MEQCGKASRCCSLLELQSEKLVGGYACSLHWAPSFWELKGGSSEAQPLPCLSIQGLWSKKQVWSWCLLLPSPPLPVYRKGRSS